MKNIKLSKEYKSIKHDEVKVSEEEIKTVVNDGIKKNKILEKVKLLKREKEIYGNESSIKTDK